MINGLFGRPRSGKSYEAVRYHIIEAVKKGRMVVTNIPVDVERIRLVYGDRAADLIVIVKTNFGDYGSIRPFSKADDFTKYSWRNAEGLGPLFVIDEMHLNCGLQADKGLLEYLSMHGHHGHDVICLTQSPRKLHKDLRDMIEISWRCAKKTAFGENNGYFKKTYHGVSTSNADSIHQEERTYDAEYFPFYKSHTLSKSSVTETVANDIKGQRNPYKKISLVMIVVGALFSTFMFSKIFMKPDKKIESSKVDKVDKVELPSERNDDSIGNVQSDVVGSGFSENSIAVSNARKRVGEYDRLKSRADDYHPYYKVSLHVSGVSYVVERGVSYKTVYFVASQNGQPMFRIDSGDLAMAGYDVQVLSDCMVSIGYFDYQDFLTCDNPSVGLEAASVSTDVDNPS